MAQPDALGGVAQADAQEDDGPSDQRIAGGSVQHGAATEREHSVVLGQRGRDRSTLQVAERGFAVVDEDLLHALARDGLDVVVGVAHAYAPPLGEQATDGGLAGPHRADEDRARTRAWGVGCRHQE